MAKPGLTEQDFADAAHELTCDVPAIKAVAEVESRNSGFLSDGRPVILFERHKFYQFTQGAHADGKDADICSRTPGGYVGGVGEWDRYSRALELNPEAAMLSASWGRFQIMGFNYSACGFQSVGEFVKAMHESEAQHLRAFVRFIKASRMDDELRAHDWRMFARLYNGPNFRDHDYDGKLAAAYTKFERLQPTTRELRETAERQTKAEAPAAPIAAPAAAAAPVSRPEDEPIEASKNGNKAWLTTLAGWVTAGGGGAWAALNNHPEYIKPLLAIVALVTVLAFLRWTLTDLHRMTLNSRPDRFNVK